MLFIDLGVVIFYIVLEILVIEENKLSEYLKDEKLFFYVKYIKDILRDKLYILSE